MSTQSERIEALEKLAEEQANQIKALADRAADLERIIRDGEALEELGSRIDTLTKALAEDTARLLDGELATAEIVEGFDPRSDLLKAFRQLEAVANHLNFRLPS